MIPQNDRRDIEDRLRQLSWPAPSAGLRDRVLSTAVVTAQPLTWSDRMWFSRAWRLTAVGAALAIIVLDQVAALPRPAAVPAIQALGESQVSVYALLQEMTPTVGAERQ